MTTTTPIKVDAEQLSVEIGTTLSVARVFAWMRSRDLWCGSAEAQAAQRQNGLDNATFLTFKTAVETHYRNLCVFERLNDPARRLVVVALRYNLLTLESLLMPGAVNLADWQRFWGHITEPAPSLYFVIV